VQLVAITTLAYFLFIITTSFNSMALITAIFFLSGIFGIVTGCFISAVADNFKASAKAHQLMFFTSLFISGVIWPIEAQPSVLKTFFFFAPFSYPTKAIRSIAFKGTSIESHDVQMAFLVLLAWITLAFSLSLTLILKKK
jgi:ABC-2 type transport system permease protein